MPLEKHIYCLAEAKSESCLPWQEDAHIRNYGPLESQGNCKMHKAAVKSLQVLPAITKYRFTEVQPLNFVDAEHGNGMMDEAVL